MENVFHKHSWENGVQYVGVFRSHGLLVTQSFFHPPLPDLLLPPSHPSGVLQQLFSPTLPERETTASNCLIFHRAYAKYVTPHVMHLTLLRLISQEITTQQAHPNPAVT